MTKLLPYARAHVAAMPRARAVLRAFRQWLEHRQMTLSELHPSDVERFLQRPHDKPQAPSTRRLYRHSLLAYLDRVYPRNLLTFDPMPLRRRLSGLSHPSGVRPLAPLPQRFLETLESTHKSSTIWKYRSALRDFHGWLETNAIAVNELDREHLCAWMRCLHQRGLHPSTRLQKINSIRPYLRWLNEQGVLPVDADWLIRSSDAPKLPQYLPRPLAPEADRELQRLLAASDCQYHLGLLLMRRTGLRIGELLRLSHDCVRTDPKGSKFLKVPLGKLDNERLVPLDDETAALVYKLRRRGRRKRPLLLETPDRAETRVKKYQRVLKKLARDLSIPDHVTSHRLRHTYATSLLAGGMSLVGLMRLLGHRSHRMTLRYAAITDEVIVNEYHQALQQSERRYRTKTHVHAPASGVDIASALTDIARALHKAAADDGLDTRRARTLVKRIERLRSAVLALLEPRRGRRRGARAD